jgi:hypothetical protein
LIVSVHIASGALAGAIVGSRRAALALGPVLHALGDRTPHRDGPSQAFEIATGVGGVLALAALRGPFDPATLGAAATAVPDVEHVVQLPRPGGRKLFPSHRYPGWHRSGGVGVAAQLVVAGAVLGMLLVRPRRP